MWSLKAGLYQIAAHLPSGFNAAHGVKSLFPAEYSGSISPLDGYVFCLYSRITTVYDFGPQDTYIGSAADAYVMADGMGRWFFSWTWSAVGLNAGYERQAGFAFKLTDNGSAHIFTDQTKPAQQIMSCNGGTDPWIADNWPAIFKAGATSTLIDKTTSDLSIVWTRLGFAKTASMALQGSSAVCAATVSGSALFPYPNVPFRLYSPLGASLGPTLISISQYLVHFADRIPSSFSYNGFVFTVSPLQEATGALSLKFASVDGAYSGSYNWRMPAGDITATGEANFVVASGQAKLNYTYTLSGGGGSAAATATLDYTAKVTHSANSWTVITGRAIGGQLVSQTQSITAPGGAVTTTSFTTAIDGAVSVNGNPSPAAVLSAIAALPFTQAQMVTQGFQSINALFNQINGTWPGSAGQYSYGSSWTDAGWTETSTGYVQNWGAGNTPMGPALYQFVVTLNSDGSIASYSMIGTLSVSANIGNPQDPPQSRDSFTSCTVDLTTQTISVFSATQIPFGPGLMTNSVTDQPMAGVAGIIWSYNQAADGTVTTTTAESVTSADGSSWQSVSSWKSVTGSTGWTVTATDAAGNTGTTTLTSNPDGSQSLQITSLDPAGNGTVETIQIDPSGATTSDTTASVDGGSGSDGDGAGGDGSDSDGDNDGSDDDEEEAGPDLPYGGTAETDT